MTQETASYWREHGVRVVAGRALDLNTPQTAGMTRTAAITHARAGASKLWAGTVTIHPHAVRHGVYRKGGNRSPWPEELQRVHSSAVSQNLTNVVTQSLEEAGTIFTARIRCQRPRLETLHLKCAHQFSTLPGVAVGEATSPSTVVACAISPDWLII